MGFLEAARQVLEDEGQPLHYEEITNRAIEQGLITTTGQTPARTMNSQITTSIRRDDSPFIRVGRGFYGLANQPPDSSAQNTSFPQPKELTQYLSFKKAAHQVLSEAGQPLHYQEITARALNNKLINSQGLTPEASMGAQLYSDVKNKGAGSAFRRVGRGTFGLAIWEKGVSNIVRLADKQRAVVKKQILDHLGDMDPADFETFAARLLGAMGYENITVTSYNNDGGIDVLADIQVGILQLRTAVQVKRKKANVQRSVISQLRGDMMTLPDMDQGMVITTAGFSNGAKEVARVRNAPLIVLIDGDQLAELLIQHEIGVRAQTIRAVSFEPDRLQPGEEE